MGQKTHPIGFRLGTTRTWSSRWFATKGYAALLHEDVKIRRYIKNTLYHAAFRGSISSGRRTGSESRSIPLGLESSSGGKARRWKS